MRYGMAKKRYDFDKIREAYDRARGRSQAERYSYEREWFRNVLFFMGIQWIVYSPQTRKWQPRRIAKWVPRPVTNKFASVASTIMQVLSSKDPDVRARPASDSPEDVAAASVADRNFDVILREMKHKEARSISAAWLTLTGNVILHPCYDKDIKHGTTFVQSLQCASCGKVFAPDELGNPVSFPDAEANQGILLANDLGGKGTNGSASAMPLPYGAPAQLPKEPQLSEGSCPYCGSPNVSPAEGDDGPIGQDFPNGSMKLEVFSPFEVFIDMEARSMDEVQELMIRRRYPIEIMRERYGKPDLEPDNNSNTGGAVGLNLLRAIAYASGQAMYGTGISSGRSLGDDQNITVDMLWKRPNKDFPEGLVAIYANDLLLNDGKGTDEDVNEGLPYHGRDGNPIWPWHIINFDRVPGRIFGKTPMSDVAPKQEQRNKLESLIQLIITRMASPQWLVAKGLGVTEFTGEPGQVIEGNWAMDPRLRPERVPGENVPTSVIAWLEKIDKDIEELAGTFEVLRGNAPPGVTAGTALRLLLERANTRFTPVLKQYEEAWEKVCQDALSIFQEWGSEERINKIQGPGNTWEVKRFTNADMNGAIDIVVEAGSAVPKSMVGDQALIQDLAAMTVINPTDPETQYKILERFGSTSLLGDVDLNIRYAQRENWKFINESKVPELNPILDENQVHLMIHKEFALTSDFEDLPEEQRNLFMGHILQHQMAMMPPLPAMGVPSPSPSPSGAEQGAVPPPPGSAPASGQEAQQEQDQASMMQGA
jgi:hypothetical protein